MEFKVSSSGKKLLSPEQKVQVLREMESGFTAPELSRKYGIPIQSFYKWKRDPKLNGTVPLKNPPLNGVPLDEYKKALAEIKQLRQALGKMTLDRDILKDAVDIATKKKWI